MHSQNRSIYKQLIPGLLLGILALFGLMILGGFKKVSSHLLTFHWLYFALAIALNFLNQTLRFLKHAINVNRSGIKNVNFLESINLFLACLPLSVTSNRVEESFKGIWLFKKSGIPVERAVSIFMVDQISDSLSVFVLMVIGTIAYPALWPLFLFLFLVFMGVLVFFKIQPSSKGTSIVSTKVPVLKSLIPQLQECIDANPALFSIGNMVITFILGILSWAAEGAALFIIMVGLGFPPSMPLIATAVLVFAFATTVSMTTKITRRTGIYGSRHGDLADTPAQLST